MRTEKILAIVSLIGIIFKCLHWPGAGVILALSLSSITMLYFPGAFYFFCDKTIKKQNLPLSIISGLFLSFVPLGILFKLMYWPGGQLYLSVSAVMAPIFFIVIYILRSKSKEDLKNYYNQMMLRTGFLTALAVLFYLTPASTLLKIQYWDDPELARLKSLYYADPYNAEIKKQHDDYLLRKDSLNMHK